MKIYDIEKIEECIIHFIKKNNIDPKLISLTLAFGFENNIETPELLVGIVTNKNYNNWIKEEDAVEYLFNQAEYEYQEIDYECFTSVIHIQKDFTREDYVRGLIGLKKEIEIKINNELKSRIMVYVHYLDDFEYDKIISNNFSDEEKNLLLG